VLENQINIIRAMPGSNKADTASFLPTVHKAESNALKTHESVLSSPDLEGGGFFEF
jgi:hypothetical protein